jgi:hypothetical protein
MMMKMTESSGGLVPVASLARSPTSLRGIGEAGSGKEKVSVAGVISEGRPLG